MLKGVCMFSTHNRRSRRPLIAGFLLSGALIVSACGGSSSSSGGTTGANETTPTKTPTGPEMVIGMVNTEGTPGLDFPDMRRDLEGVVTYLNSHGGFGNRPIRLETCVAKGSPETSQACAQELIGKKVELVLLGLDLFPDYKAYTAAKIPVIGVLPILPGDYKADALFLTGGNATVMSAITAVLKDNLGAKSVGIVGADNPGANSTAASLIASLKVAGISHTLVKGGDNETDAGYQGLMREAAKDNPDAIVSLYSDAGCIGTIRGRAALGLTMPVVTTGICSGNNIIDVVGDDASDWYFAGVTPDTNTPAQQLEKQILAPVLGVSASDVELTGLGLGGLAYLMMMSLNDYATQMATAGTEVTGTSLYSYLKSTKGLTLYGGGAPIECGSAPKYPAICSFIFPFVKYEKGKGVIPADGMQAIDSRKYLP